MTIITNVPSCDMTQHRDANNSITTTIYGLIASSRTVHIINTRAKMPVLPNIDKRNDTDINRIYEYVYNEVRKNGTLATIKDLSDCMLNGIKTIDSKINNWEDEFGSAILQAYGANCGDSQNTTATPKSLMSLEKTMTKMIDFFSEFAFVPSFRFLDTLAHKAKDDAIPYIVNYFKLSGNGSADDVKEKMNSMEFDEIMKSFYGNITSSETCVNRRLKVYFGSAGTGKTTQALAEANNNCIICNNDTAPSDLMEDFTFEDGKATFHPSVLAKAMENGEKIVLDEINLLPFSSLRFLQGITDGKSEFMYKGNSIHINEGFEIIGTMNLTFGGMVYGLPEPLVDRCSDIEEYAMTGKKLASFFKK